MSTADASKSAGATGIELRFDGDDFALSAAAAPHAAVLDALFQHKIGIVALLRPGRDGWSAEDWQAYFDERAGVAEFAGGLSRAEAEAHARVLRCGVVDPQLRSLALRPLCRMRRSRAAPRSASALRTEADRFSSKCGNHAGGPEVPEVFAVILMANHPICEQRVEG